MCSRSPHEASDPGSETFCLYRGAVTLAAMWQQIEECNLGDTRTEAAKNLPVFQAQSSICQFVAAPQGQWEIRPSLMARRIFSTGRIHFLCLRGPTVHSSSMLIVRRGSKGSSIDSPPACQLSFWEFHRVRVNIVIRLLVIPISIPGSGQCDTVRLKYDCLQSCFTRSELIRIGFHRVARPDVKRCSKGSL